jgi:hypothetical protein
MGAGDDPRLAEVFGPEPVSRRGAIIAIVGLSLGMWAVIWAMFAAVTR